MQPTLAFGTGNWNNHTVLQYRCQRNSYEARLHFRPPLSIVFLWISGQSFRAMGHYARGAATMNLHILFNSLLNFYFVLLVVIRLVGHCYKPQPSVIIIIINRRAQWMEQRTVSFSYYFLPLRAVRQWYCNHGWTDWSGWIKKFGGPVWKYLMAYPHDQSERPNDPCPV